MESSPPTRAAEVRRPARGSARRVLLVTGDAVGPLIGGSAIRCLEIARALSVAGHRPTVATPELRAEARREPFPVRSLGRERPDFHLTALLNDSDVIVASHGALFAFPSISRSRLPLVVDLYDPFAFELLEATREQPLGERQYALRAQAPILRRILTRGDFFVCASERQRDLWLGALLSAGRIAPFEGSDPCFRRLVDVVPFGLPSHPPVAHEAAVLKGVHPSISADDAVVGWGGGLWAWLDPLTPIRAVARLAAGNSTVHLAFLGTEHPGGLQEPGRRMQDPSAARDLARELGVLDHRVHFLADWLPYAERSRYMAELDAGITTNPRTLESRFAFRSRFLDYLWTGLPILCTEGDELAGLVEREGLGLVVPPEDEAALAEAIERVVSDPAFAAACREQAARVRPRYAWERVVRPLVEFCDHPRLTHEPAGAVATLKRGGGDARRVAAEALAALGSGGPRELARRARRRLTGRL